MPMNNGAGGTRFASGRRRRNPSDSSIGSAQSNFSVAAVGQQRHRQQPNYEPGTGAAYMAQAGWNDRDDYGRPRQSATVFPVFTPAPRQPHRHPGEPGAAAAEGQRQGQKEEEEPQHRTTFTEGPNYKKVYLIALVIVSLLLLALIGIVVVLLATKVFIYNRVSAPPQAQPPAAAGPSPLQPLVLPPPPPTTLSLPPLLPPPSPQPAAVPNVAQPQMVARTFECEFYILDQANQAYDNAGSFETFQAQSIVQNALIDTVKGSSLRDMNPTVTLDKLENSGSDLHVVFRLGIVALEQNLASLQEVSIRNVLLSEAGLLEGLLNRTSLDRTRVSVRTLS